jgi:MFS family permease
VCVLRTIRKAEYAELVALYFMQGAAIGMWTVPLSRVLDAHGLQAIKPYAFACSALAAFVSPLIFGAMADRHFAPVVVLRWVSLATAAAMAFGEHRYTTRVESLARAWLHPDLLPLLISDLQSGFNHYFFAAGGFRK